MTSGHTFSLLMLYVMCIVDERRGVHLIILRIPQNCPFACIFCMVPSTLNVLSPPVPGFHVNHLTLFLCGPATCYFFSSLALHHPSYPRAYSSQCWTTHMSSCMLPLFISHKPITQLISTHPSHLNSTPLFQESLSGHSQFKSNF
jgi:hypothetical protein